MFIGKSQRISLVKISFIFVIVVLTASCGGGGATSSNIVEQYYSAIKARDADAAAAFFADDAVVTTPSGNVLTGIDAIESNFIPFDLEFMDRVEFLSDFTESNGKISWTQNWHGNEGATFFSECEVTIENGKIVEWIFQ
jgi:hypothetical protein